jgi:glycosyltransferase involved in cell wall biosynthesis
MATRVLFLGHGAERTGPPLVLAGLLEGLAAEAAWDLQVLVARGGPLEDRYRAAGATVRAVAAGREPLEPLAAGLRRAHLSAFAARLQRAARRRAATSMGPADLVYVNAATPPTAALVRALDPPATVPVVVHVHELDVGLRRTLAADDLALLLGRADRLLAVSDAVADLLVDGHGVAADRIDVCPGFVDLDAHPALERAAARRRLGLPADAAVVGSVGVPDWRKDPEHLLRAVAQLADRPGGAPHVVWIGGDPTSTDGIHLADEAARLGLSDRVVHVAHLDDPRAVLSALDVFALPAREDAMPLAVLEAAAAELPVVAFRTGGAAGLCDAGAGTAVDYPRTDALAAAIATYLDDPDLARRTGRAGRALVEADHGAPAGVARISAALRSVLDGRAPTLSP